MHRYLVEVGEKVLFVPVGLAKGRGKIDSDKREGITFPDGGVRKGFSKHNGRKTE